MSDQEGAVSDDDVQRFIDGRLAPEREVVVQRFLRDCPHAQALVRSARTIVTELRVRLAAEASAPIPARLRVSTILARRRARAYRRMAAVAASIAFLLIGLASGWEANALYGPRFPAASSFAQAEVTDALSAHRVYTAETVHPVEVPATQRVHLVQWLSRRVGRTLTVPDLSKSGFELMGGRVIPSGVGVAAQFMFEDGSAHRLTLFVKADDGTDVAFKLMQAEGLRAFSWVDAGLGFALVGNLDRTALLALATDTYHQLDPAARN